MDNLELSDQATSIGFDDVTVTYKGSVALEAFSLTVEAGEVMALIGPSGSGKTTALRAVAGFVSPSRGRVLLGTRDVTHTPPRDRHIGMVVQQYALFPHMRVYDNVAFGLRAQRAKRTDVASRVRESLELVGMLDYAHRFPQELSGGQQQRIAIARALAVRPQVLLLDEPLSALDAQLRSGMLAEIARLHRELPALTILYVTHDQSEALTIADRITVMHESRLVDVGTAKGLYQRPPSRFTAEFLGNANLIPVKLEKHDHRHSQARVRLGERLCEVATFEEMGSAGDYTLCVRPHSLCLEPDSQRKNVVDATLVSTQWLGSMYRLFLDVAGCEVRVETTAVRTFPDPGAPMELYFDANEATLIEGTRR